MFGYYLGTFWIVLGSFFLWRPASLVKRIKKKGNKLIRRYLIAFCTFGSGTIFGLAFDIPGFWSKVVSVVLVIALWSAAFRWYGTIKERLAAFCEEEMDAGILKRVALVHVIVGIVILAVTIIKMKL